MAEKSFWIQYDDKTPVKIENLYVNDQKRQRPLTDVGDLIAAYKTQTLPRFQNVPLDELSLYWCGSDGNTPKKLDSDILLTDLGESGSTIKKALIIMEGDRMQADPGSTLSFQPSNNLLGYPFTGRKGSANQIGMLGTNDLRLAQSQDIFDVGLPFPANSGAIHEEPVIDRSGLVNKILMTMENQMSLLITSPSFTGKTALANLVYLAWQRAGKNVRYLTLASFRTGDNLDQHFRRELKVGYQDLLVSDGFLILDEVQNIYDQDHFWTGLKSGAQRRRVLAFGVFGLSTVGDSRSPLEFQSKWYYDDIKFTNDECNELVKTFKKVVSGADEILNSEYLGDLFGYLNNHPGLVYMALHHLCIEFRRAPFNAGNAAEILILVANGTLLDQLFRKARCFALDYSKIRNLLSDNADQMMGHLLTTGSLRLVDKTFGLHRAGVCIADLGETKVYFSSEIMREYYRRLFYKAIYNVDAIAVITEWETESVRSFLVRILEKFNPTVFQTSNARGRDGRLYERIYQDEFYRCCFLLTPAHCHPDVGVIYGSRGYLDFYIDGDVSWGFELLRNSNKLNSHRQRFDPSSGRYRDIPLTDFAIVDFYETDSNVTNSNVSVDDGKYYKVVFQDNFNSVKLYNQGETYVITCGN